ncbi:MAG: BatD family protein [Elusimicrobiales bacterium]|nr:BatD family protein [Elusimicrobiales bacterium]
MNASGKCNPAVIARRAVKSAAAALLLACATAGAAFAQLTINASVDRETVTLDDSLTLTVTINGATTDVGEPQLPSLPNFNIQSSAQSQNIMINNGRISSSLKYNFTLTPRFVGAAVIDPVTLHYHGADYATKSIRVKVLPPASGGGGQPPVSGYSVIIGTPSGGGGGQPSSRRQPRARRGDAGKDAFVTAQVDKKTAWVNEQITLTVRFYTAVALLGNPDYVPPSAKSFLTEDLPPLRNGQETIGNKLYYYTEIKTALFGAAPGQTVIAPAVVRYQPRQDADIDPFDPNFFQNFFSRGIAGSVTREARTEALAVHLKPLPEEGKPDDFNGAVGSFRIISSVDRREMKAGEAANLTITVESSGNLKAIGAPALPGMPGIKVYDFASSLNLKKDGDIVQGSKTFKAIIIPKSSGKIAIPALQFSYFNPETASYRRIASLPITLSVLPGENQNAQQISFSPGAGPEVTALSEDIHYINEDGAPGALQTLLTRAAALRLWNLLPLAALALSFAFARMRRAMLSDTALLRRRKAYASAKTAVREAEKLFGKNQIGPAVSALSDALRDYLCAKLSCPISGLTLKKTVEMMKTAYPGMKSETLTLLSETWEELDLLRFAPPSQSAMQQGAKPISVRLLGLLEKLESEMKK